MSGLTQNYSGIHSGVERIKLIQLNSMMVGRKQMYSSECKTRIGGSQWHSMESMRYYQEWRKSMGCYGTLEENRHSKWYHPIQNETHAD